MEGLAPTRSRTEPVASDQHRTQREGIRRRLHAGTLGQLQTNNPRLHNQYSYLHHRHGAKDTTQSAVELKPPISFDHHLRRKEKRPPEEGPREAAPGRGDGSPATLAEEKPPRHVRPQDVAKAKRDNVKREEQLRADLKSLEEIGMSSTRQLDDTYYTILDKAAILRSTVASLQRLANECKSMHSTFSEGTQSLERETTNSIKSFGNFDQQEDTINELVKNLQTSRSNTDKLNDRLETARLRVEAYETRYNAKQAKRKAQWHMAWLTTFGVVVVIVAILVLKNRERVGDAVEQQLLRIGDLVDDVAAPGRARSKAPPVEDPYLHRLLDEL